MKFEEYRGYDALGLAQLVKKKDVTPKELLDVAIRRADKVNPRINAIITPLYEQAAEQIRESTGHGDFAGVPFLLKDLQCAMKGVPLSGGSEIFRNFVPDHDSHLVRRFRDAGVVIFGKTNTPEFGLMGITEPDAFGPSRNPWNIDHTPGGSSGGSAAAIAAGIVPMASAGDGGGSIRIPAACCGLFGLKPTRGRVNPGPDLAESWDGAAIEHVITRSVRDSATMLDNICGPADGDPYYVARPERTFAELMTEALPPLRIGFSTASPVGMNVDAEAIAAVEDAAEKLSALGHHVEEVPRLVDGEAVARCYLTMYFGHVGAQLLAIEKQYGKKALQDGVEPATQLIGSLGMSLSAAEFVEAKLQWNTFSRAMAGFHQNYDLYLTPCLAEPPVKVGSIKPKGLELQGIKVANRLHLGKALLKSGIVEKLAKESLEKTPYTQLANLTGQPGMSVPLYWTQNGLPLGVQFVAPMNREDILLQLARQLEEAYPWMDKVAKL